MASERQQTRRVAVVTTYLVYTARRCRSKHVGCQGRIARIFYTEGKEKSEAIRADSGGGVLGEWTASPPLHQLGRLGERCKLPMRGPGQSPDHQTVFTRFKSSEYYHVAPSVAAGRAAVGSCFLAFFC